jgi:hypothetical protein
MTPHQEIAIDDLARRMAEADVLAVRKHMRQQGWSTGPPARDAALHPASSPQPAVPVLFEVQQ